MKVCRGQAFMNSSLGWAGLAGWMVENNGFQKGPPKGPSNGPSRSLLRKVSVPWGRVSPGQMDSRLQLSVRWGDQHDGTPAVRRRVYLVARLERADMVPSDEFSTRVRLFMEQFKMEQSPVEEYLKDPVQASASPFLQKGFLLEGRRRKSAEKDAQDAELVYTRYGKAYPPAGLFDASGELVCTTSLWRMPSDGFVCLHGLSQRSSEIMFFRMAYQCLAARLHGSVCTTKSELSWQHLGFTGKSAVKHPDVTTGLKQGAIPTITAQTEPILIVSGHPRLKDQIRWIAIDEMFRLMELPLESIIPPCRRGDLHHMFKRRELVGIAGMAFHMVTALAFILSSLMGERLSGCDAE